MKTILHCSTLFIGAEDGSLHGVVLIVDGYGQLVFVGPEAGLTGRWATG